MTTPFAMLNQFLASPMNLRPGKTYRLPIKSLPSAGFVCSVSIEGAAIEAEFEDVSAKPVSHILDPGSVAVGGAVEQFLVVNAKEHGLATLVLRHARPWQSDDPLAEERRIQVQVIDPVVQEAWEAAVPMAEVSNEEVRLVLDRIDGAKPYGGKRVAHVRSVLEIMARDIAAHRHAGVEYELSDWKIEGMLPLLPRGAFPRATATTVRAAMEAFVSGRA